MMAEENEEGISPALVAPALSILKEFYSSLSGRNKKKFQKTLRSIHAYIHIYTHGVRIEEYSDSMIKLLLEIKDDPFFTVIVQADYRRLVRMCGVMEQSTERHKSYLSDVDKKVVEDCIGDLNISISNLSGHIKDGKYSEIKPTLYALADKSNELYGLCQSSLDISHWLDVI